MTLVDAPTAAALGARRFFLDQHAFIHSIVDSFVFGGLSEDQLRTAPPTQNALAFLLWHAARWEDVVVNAWLADGQQVLERYALPRGIGTGMTAHESAALAAHIDLGALGSYWAAVGQRTAAIVESLAALDAVVSDEQLARAAADGADANPNAGWLDGFFSGKTVAWHLSFLNVHLIEHVIGEASSVRGQLGIPLPQ